jgi:hypothetical protein
MNFRNLPIEVLLITREFLHEQIQLVWLDDLQNFVRNESERSWRSFLSMSKAEDWLRIRKHCMIWTLNRYESTKYLQDNLFKSYLDTKMNDPARQLHLTFHGIGKMIPSNAADQRLSFENLHSLCLFSCHSIQSISVPNLTRLKLVSCTNIPNLHGMRKLTAVSCIGCSGEILASLPLEQLQRFQYQGSSTAYLPYLSRLSRLEELVLTITESLPAVLPFPRLKSLTVRGAYAINVTELGCLTALDVSRCVDFITITGKEQIFPQLKSFRGHLTSLQDLELFQKHLSSQVHHFLLEEGKVDCFLQAFPRLTELEIEYMRIPAVELRFLSQSNQIQSIKITLPSFMSLSPEKIPQRIVSVSLRNDPSLVQLPAFHNLQQFHLHQCFDLQKIDSLARIPYLTISSCSKIDDFSCLGQYQRYLSIKDCVGLKNSDLEKFGNVCYLSISKCDNITFINESALVNNRFLFFLVLKNLREITLSGSGYLKVAFWNCPLLESILIKGRIYLLDVNIRSCSKVDVGNISRNYQYIQTVL